MRVGLTAELLRKDSLEDITGCDVFLCYSDRLQKILMCMVGL